MILAPIACLGLLLPGPDPRGRNQPRIPPHDDVNVYYGGIVLAVTRDSITIQYKNWIPKKFEVSETLAKGDIPMHPRLGHNRGKYSVSATSMYRLTDVKVGDLVDIQYAWLGGKSICDHICIQKRPGGKVPPLPPEAEALMIPSYKDPPYIPYHEKTEAYWNLEDKGIPYPEKFGKNRRFPVAPPPRPVDKIPKG